MPEIHKIYKITPNPTVDFAAEELKKYLRMMMPRVGDFEIEYNPGAKDGFRLGLMQDFGLSTEEAEDVELDDILHIDTEELSGIIAGSNARSVLLAVYRYLRLNGCRWLFPGLDGEYIPIQDVKPTKFHKMADMRIRAQCNEGAESQQSVLDAVDFTPKLGMNTFMIEFDIPFNYYNKYYAHTSNEANREPEPVTKETVLQWKRVSEVEMNKRGLQIFDMGHGWTSEALGISSTAGWVPDKNNPVPEETRQYLALVDGKRGLFRDVALNTQICMSNPAARKLVVDEIVRYARTATNIFVLKISLADYMNNHCECEECQKMRPSDFYVRLLNEADNALRKEGIKIRLGYTVYSDTTWAPEHETLDHPEDFVPNFAPISRDYIHTVDAYPEVKEITPYVRNKTGRLASFEEYLWHGHEWAKQTGCKYFAYEYHFWKAQFYSPSCITWAKRLQEDVIAYKKNDLIGMMEDCSQRHFFPNALAFTTYANTLFDLNADFEKGVDDYFEHAYGECKDAVKNFFTELEKIFPLKFVHTQHTRPVNLEKYHDKNMIPFLEQVPALCDQLDAVLEEHKNMPYRAQTIAIRVLRHYTTYLRGLSNVFKIKATGDDDGAVKAYLEFADEFGKYERDIDAYYDHCLFRIAFNPIFNAGKSADM